MSDLIEPLKFIRYDYCDRCSQTKIELFDYFNNPMGYSKMVLGYIQNGDVPEIINRKAVYRMRCRGCGKDYAIQWDNNFPRPIHDKPENRFMNIFLGLYKEDNDKNRRRVNFDDIL